MQSKSPRRLLIALLSAAAFPAHADSPKIKVAVFDFELNDFSAAAGIAANSAADLVQLDRATQDVRQLLAKSGRYTLVNVADIPDEAVRERTLWQCNGCDAAIARKRGADESFFGLITRISRTEYTVQFQLRDARTGALIMARQSGLRMGADYSWNRGAAALVNDTPLTPSNVARQK